MKDGTRPPAVALRTTSEEEAVDKAFELHGKGALHCQSHDRMDDLIPEYLNCQKAARIHTDKTSDITRRTLEQLSREWGNPQVASITRKKIEDWRLELQGRKGLAAPLMSEASIGSYLRRLSGFLSWLVNGKHLREHPMKGIRLGRVKKTRRERFCTIEEREVLLEDAPTDEIEFILYFGFFAGLRFGEMLAMKKSWFEERGGGGLLITVQESAVWKPKDQECRSIEVHPRLQEFLKVYGMKEPYMLAPKKKVWKEAPHYRFNPKKAFKTYVSSKGMKWVSYHTLRHSFATHMASKGAKMIEIAQVLGDSLRVTEETYIGFSPESKSSISSI